MALGTFLRRRQGGRAAPPPAAPPGAAQPARALTEALLPYLTRLEPARIAEPYIHASSLWDLCTRERALATALAGPEGTQEVITPQDAATFDIGKAVHDWVRDRWLGPMGWLWGEWECQACRRVWRESTLPPQCVCRAGTAATFHYIERAARNEEWRVIGHLDGIERDPVRGYGIVELKTMDGNRFRILQTPLAEHVFRIHVYCWLAGYTWGRILYVSKAQAKVPFKEFVVHFDLRVIERVTKALAEAREGGRRSCRTPTDARALACPFAGPCWRAATT